MLRLGKHTRSESRNYAGCMVTNGKILRTHKLRLTRDGVVLHTGELISLKRFKDDVKEVSKGYDCGIQIKDFNDLKVGDSIEFYDEIAVRKNYKFSGCKTKADLYFFFISSSFISALIFFQNYLL